MAVIRGVPVDLHSPLYVYLIAPAWKMASGSDAFSDAQTIGAILLSLTVVPGLADGADATSARGWR